MHASVQPPAEHQAHADARTDVHEREVVGFLANAERPLGERGGVHVVLDRERRTERRAQPGERLRLVPARQAAGQRHQVPLRVVDTGAADDRLGDRRAGDPCVRAQVVGEPDKLGDPAVDAGGNHRGALVGARSVSTPGGAPAACRMRRAAYGLDLGRVLSSGH